MLKLDSPSNPTLSVARTLVTGSETLGGGGIPSVQMVQQGSVACIFIADGSAGDIASFAYPTWTKIGNYTDPQVPNTKQGILIAARSKYLVAAYNGQSAQAIGVWSVGSGCTLNLLNTVRAPQVMNSIALSPDSKTLAVAYFSDGILPSSVDSFSVGPNGQLTEHGPYNEENIFNWAASVDITADSKYAVFGEYSYGGVNGIAYTEVGIFPINPDGSLGQDHDFGGTGSLGAGYGVNAIWLSPDERFLFVSDAASGSQQITTLNYNETTISVSYGCITTRRNNGNVISVAQIATVLPSGSGGYIYVAESGIPGYVALFTVNPSTGCTTEVPGSPFTTGKSKGEGLQSLVAWPPRPF